GRYGVASVLLSLEHAGETIEQVGGVVRSGRRFGVVLHGEGTAVEELDALDRTVVGAGVADDRATERGVELLAGLPFEREPVVLRGDRDAAGLVLDHRDVDAAVTELHLVGAQAERAAEDLVAEADAEQGQSLAEHLLGQV